MVGGQFYMSNEMEMVADGGGPAMKETIENPTSANHFQR